MNPFHPFLTLASLAAFAVGCGGPSGTLADAGDSSTSPVTITFLYVNDLHAHLTPHADLVPDGPYGQTSSGTRIVERGGLARLATLIQQIRAESPHSVLMNVGDTYHGGVEALYTLGNAIVDPVDALGVDVGVPGNWDFAYGPVVTRLRYTGVSNLRLPDPGIEIRGPAFPNLAANVTYTLPPSEAGQAMLPATMLRDVGGVSIGFIGIASDIVATMYEPLAFGFDFVQGEDAYRQLVDEHAQSLRTQGAAVVVVMSELGIQKDYRLAQIVRPGVDVFFSAHTHEAIFTPLTSASGALVVEAGNDGYLGRMDVALTGGAVVDRRWQLLPIGTDLAEDPAVRDLVDRERAPFLAPGVNMTVPLPGSDQTLTEPIDTVVGRATLALDRRHAIESRFNDAFADLLRLSAGTQTAITPGFRFDAVVAAPGTVLEDGAVTDGSVTIEDVYRFFPVPYLLATGEATAGRLRQIVEEALTHVFSPTAFLQGGGWFDGLSGLDLTVDLAAPDGARVSHLGLAGAGADLPDATVLTVAGCRRPLEAMDILCSYSGFSNVASLVNPATGSAWTPVDLFIAELPNMSAVARHSIVDTSGTVFWPEGVFVQPLEGAGH